MPGISDLLDSDMEENNFLDENSILSNVSDSTEVMQNTETSSTAKKSKKRHRVTMPKSKSKVVKSSPPPAKKPARKGAATKRKALEEATNTADGDALLREVTDQEDGMEVDITSQTKRKGIAKKPTRKAKTNVNLPEDEIMEPEQNSVAARSNHAQNATERALPKVARVTKAIKKTISKDSVPEPQPELIDVATEAEEIDEIATQQPPPKRARTESKTRQDAPYYRRAGSASDTERGDPNLRRKLGDVTRKFENIDMKYKNLREVGITEASANVEKLRKQCEATTEASNNLVSSLKKELAQQAPMLQDMRKLKKELQAREDETAKLRSSEAGLMSALGTAQNEIKALQAKLAAARAVSASAEPPAGKVPGSAIKAARPSAAVNAEAAQAVQMAQMKLDLYGDLTGLIVRSVKRSEDGDTFDCIQTGRNGTLHFKLFIDLEDAKSASFEETEFLYTPLLDPNRDRDMMELMPPYLAEDITFARQNAAKFYQRVVDTLTRRANEG